MESGVLIIKTEVNSSGIDKGIAAIEAKMEKLRKKAETPYELDGAMVTGVWNLSKEEQEYYDRLDKSLGKLEAKKLSMVTTEQQITTSMQEQSATQEKIVENVNQWVGNTMRLSNGWKVIKKDAKELEDESRKIDFSRINKSVESVGGTIKKVTKRLTKMAFAVFGIRSAFMFVRNAINTISAGDEQLKADIDYMKTALAYTLEPFVRRIVELAKQLMTYVGYIIKAWTGKNIFENANKSLKNATGSASALNKELNKTIAGFDEMNTLQDDSSSDSSGGGGGVSPSIDLSDLENIDVPDWIKWIANNGELIKKTIIGIGLALASLKLASLLQTLGLFSSLPLWQLTAGIGLILTGIITTISGIIDFIKEPSWKNFLKILEGIALTIAGIAVLMGGWVVALVALGAAIIAHVIRNWDKVKEILGTVAAWIMQYIIEPVGKILGAAWAWLVQAAIDTWGSIKATFADVAGFFGKVFGDAWETVKNIFSTGGRIFMGITHGILEAFKTIVNAIIDGINDVVAIPFRGINTALNALRNLDLWGWRPFEWLGLIDVPRIPRLAKGGIVNNPGPGVMMGNYVAGERGAEAVIPLDDETLDRLGNAFAKHTVINATLINQMNGRTISRELHKMAADSDFLYNR